MKVKVKKGYIAFYNLRLVKEGDIVNVKENVCPLWAECIPVSEVKSNPKPDVVTVEGETADKQNEAIQNPDVVTDEGETADERNEAIQNPEDIELLKEKYSSLLDEAVSKGIIYDDNADIPLQQKIYELSVILDNNNKNG